MNYWTPSDAERERIENLPAFSVAFSESGKYFVHDTIVMYDDLRRRMQIYLPGPELGIDRVLIDAERLVMDRNSARLIGLALLHFSETGELPKE